MKFGSIQYLRALAALAVVFHHARTPLQGLYDPLASFQLGRAGVDIFFVISGFVMFAAARDEAPLDFLRRRAARVAPLYWIATLAFLTLSALAPHGGPRPSVADLLQSLAFIPHYSSIHPGMIWPCLILGWTLTLEVFFYLVFALGLATRRVLPVLCSILVALVAAGLVLKSTDALWVTYSSPLLLEFLAGVLIARWSDRLRAWPLALLLPAGLALFCASALWDGPRALVWGAPAAMVVIGVLTLENRRWLPHWPALGLLGDASYSIYLFQVIALPAAWAAIHSTPLRGPVQLLALIGLSLAASIAVGLLAHFGLERPLLRSLGRRRPGPSQPSPGAA